MSIVERNAVFVYPDLNLLSKDREEMKVTHRLVTNMYTIVDMANKRIEDILYCGAFLQVNCLPTAKLTMMSTISDSEFNIDNIRICIIKYKNIDYSNNYISIVNDYKAKRCDISHLVALHILDDDDNQVTFEKDEADRFDVIIKSNRSNLQNILVSIMLDISLYHYFLLSKDINERIQFNKKKICYIIENNPPEQLMETYGNIFLGSVPKYLPFSLMFVKEAYNKHTQIKLDKVVRKTLDKYSDFISKKLCTDVIVNRNGNIRNINQYNDCFISNVQDATRKSPSLKKIVIACYDSTEKAMCTVLEYNKDKSFSDNWIKDLYDLPKAVQSYKIFSVTLEES